MPLPQGRKRKNRHGVTGVIVDVQRRRATIATGENGELGRGSNLYVNWFHTTSYKKSGRCPWLSDHALKPYCRK